MYLRLLVLRNKLCPWYLRVCKIFLGIGIDSANDFAKRLQQDYGAQVYTFNYKKDSGNVNSLAATLKEKYDVVIIGIHKYSRRPANQFGIPDSTFRLINLVQTQMPAITFVFGNPVQIT